MSSSFVCVCDASFHCLRALTTHKQTCTRAQYDTRINCSVLRSLSTLRAGASDDDIAAANDEIYFEHHFTEYNNDACSNDDHDDNIIRPDDNCASDLASDDGDEHSATIRFDDLVEVYDELHRGGEYQFYDCIDDSDMSWSTASSSSSSESNSSVLSFEESPLPEYTPSLFSTVPPHLSAAYQFQVEMNSLLDRNKASLTMYDEIVRLMNAYITSPEFNRNILLKTRKQFMAYSEKLFHIESLKPTIGNVKLCNNTLVSVPVFDAQSMILSLLHDPSIMQEENFAPGYDIYTGAQDDSECNDLYGEIHTGDKWVPALNQHCGTNGAFMPVALILFGDKSHTDLHGLLSVEPVSFTLSLFNRSARNLPRFWRLLGYIPNLSAGMGEANRTSATDKVQNHHHCLSFVFKSLREIYDRGGIRTTVMGRKVHIKVWVHLIIGDTEGNNKWLGHYPGNNPGIKRPYRDCHCTFHDLGKVMPNCIYSTIDEMEQAQALLRRDKRAGLELFQSMSRYPISNALLHPSLPLSDHIHGPFRMTPPELLHTSGAGLIMYIFHVMAELLGSGIIRNEIDQQHVTVTKALRRQSERDTPRGATRNGVVDGTKCQASERRGNLFSITCMAHTTIGKKVLKEGLRLSDAKWRVFLLFIRQYLALEEWFHAHNRKDEVRKAPRKIGRVMKMLKDLFPRGEGTNGYNIPKMHGMMKMQPYILLYGSAENFHGGTGESAHKGFVKAPGLKTQRRVSEFAVQTAMQYHHVMITCHAHTSMTLGYALVEAEHANGAVPSTIMDGKYKIDMLGEDVEEKLSFLHDDLVTYYRENWREICRGMGNATTTITGYTRGRAIDEDGNQTIFYAHPSYRGSPWYDWAYVHFIENEDEETYYPSKVLGFVDTANGVEAVIQCSSKPLKWSTVERNMFVSFELGITKTSFVTVPLHSFVYPLCVLRDYGGPSNRYMVVLPRKGWVQYFGTDIA